MPTFQIQALLVYPSTAASHPRAAQGALLPRHTLGKERRLRRFVVNHTGNMTPLLLSFLCSLTVQPWAGLELASVDQAGLKRVDSLALHHDCWNYRCEPPCPEEVINLCSNK